MLAGRQLTFTRMPLYQEWSPNSRSLAAIWLIEEPESFFSDKTGLTPTIRHPRKRAEHLCGRYLLQYLKEDFPLQHIAPDAHDKPRLPEDVYFFSISHSYPYVTAVISDREECGIDIQIWKDSIEGIAHMYLSEDEQKLCADARMLTLAWTAKEAAYKWWGRRGVDFIRDMPIQLFVESQMPFLEKNIPGIYYASMRCADEQLTVKSILNKDFALSLVINYRPDKDK